ncbi:hypothetical protein Pa4123_82920 [Phytohabitans aurantiacus]|uniref:Uncharacterized protein n=1 Tax=Phytohabitans aurantiacus TaxID=3016789 RepID=A0ABQ5R8D0_9ACTN|nr:hypothetical protein Pa4123_82920 [Phytohabitans aurantiacus]
MLQPPVELAIRAVTHQDLGLEMPGALAGGPSCEGGQRLGFEACRAARTAPSGVQEGMRPAGAEVCCPPPPAAAPIKAMFIDQGRTHAEKRSNHVHSPLIGGTSAGRAADAGGVARSGGAAKREGWGLGGSV